MEVYEAIYGRQSIRSFDPIREVSEELVLKLLRAACQAPSAGNLQPWRFWVVRGAALKEKLVEAALGQDFIGEAPVVILVLGDLRAASSGYGERGTRLYYIQDAAAAAENLLLAAHSEGLGACWVGAFDERRVEDFFELPDHLRPLAIIPVGYPSYRGKKSSKKDALEVSEFK